MLSYLVLIFSNAELLAFLKKLLKTANDDIDAICECLSSSHGLSSVLRSSAEIRNEKKEIDLTVLVGFAALIVGRQSSR